MRQAKMTTIFATLAGKKPLKKGTFKPLSEFWNLWFIQNDELRGHQPGHKRNAL